MAILPGNKQIVRAGLSSSEFDPQGPWQQQMKSAIRDVGTLCRALGLPEEFTRTATGMDPFPVFVPPAFLDRIKPGDPIDPLLRQVLPVAAESEDAAGFEDDPLKESGFNPQPGLLHKYRGRVLLVITGACAIHCRYCFRRHFPYSENSGSRDDWAAAIEKISKDKSIEEVLLSGGDPLTLSDDRFADLVSRLENIPHLRRLRIHSRLPIVIPTRLTEPLIDVLAGTRLQVVFVAHINHANEIDETVQEKLSRLADTGIMLLNQSVLLKGVNDNAPSLIELSRRLIECRVLPYYLHQLDRVAGAAHFEVPVEQGQEIIATLRAELPGYAVPRYVQEIPGEPNKTVLA